MNLDQALPVFVDEARDLLQALEGALLRAEAGTGMPDDIHAMFRAAHTIKGSAGLFGLEHIVTFTHVMESVLDRVRNGALAMEGDLSALLLACCDRLHALVEAAARGETPSADECASGNQLAHALHAHLEGGAALPVALAPAAIVSNDAAQVCSASEPAGECWHVSVRFGSEVFRNGMDPLSFLRYLGSLGELAHVELVPDAIPAGEAMDAEACYLGFELRLRSSATKAQIESTFDFVRDDCQLRILAPHSKLDEYIALINSLPEEPQRLGDILIRCGALTPRELEQALALQVNVADEPARPRLGEILVHQGVVEQPVVATALDKQKRTEDKRAQELKLIKVHADKLDHLINLVGELVIAGAAAQTMAQRAHDPALNEASAAVSRLVEGIRDGALRLRMVQIAEVFSRFQRVVRDVSRELGKDIELQISGAETELDKSMVEKLADPLMHLVRNAIDHGIEATDVRLARGKPARGTLRLNAYHDSGSIVIEVTDDGGGIDRRRVLAKAVEKGLVAADQTLADREVLNLIMAPGFSTAEQVTNLSGRGVGMDVVKRNIEQLRGSIEIDSREGAGTTMCIRMPLTLAIIDGFLVRVGGRAYVLPLDSVIECVELPERAPEQPSPGRSGGGTCDAPRRNYIDLRSEVLPFLRLRDVFEMEGQAPRRESVVVTAHAGQKVGVVVDELAGELQAVIKPLGCLFSQVRGLSGSTIIGSGEVALIVDVPALVQRAVQSPICRGERALAAVK